MLPLSAGRLSSLAPVSGHVPRQPWVSSRTRLPGVRASSGFPQCIGRWGPEVTELRLRPPSPEGLREAEGRGVQGAGRYRGGALWGRGQSRSSGLGYPPLRFSCRQCLASGRVLFGLGDLSTWRCSKVVGGSSGPSYFFLVVGWAVKS